MFARWKGCIIYDITITYILKGLKLVTTHINISKNMTDSNTISITFLNIDDIRIQKNIHISKEFNHRVYDADLVYWRKLATSSKLQYKLWNSSPFASNLYVDADSLSDKYDEFILNVVKIKYPDATMFSSLILTEEDRNRRRQVLGNYKKDFLEFRILPKVDIDYCLENNIYTFDGFFQRINLYATEHKMPMFANEGDSLYYDLGNESIIRDFMDELYDAIINTL